MKEATKKQISVRALYLLATRLEELIQEKAKRAEELLLKRNEIRKQQGLRETARITEELLGEVLGSV
jgi:hypothetical protein